jgi:uncharacterized repeat protein (TIGR03803 family)
MVCGLVLGFMVWANTVQAAPPLNTISSLGFTPGTGPFGPIQASDGALYGTTYAGGVYGEGTVFKVTTGGTLRTLYSFSPLRWTDGSGLNPDGANPSAGLIQASDGNLYGTTYRGGMNGMGTVFKITTAGKLTTLHTFGAPGAYGFNVDGSGPAAALLQARDGNLYGTCSGGGNTAGTVFRITTGGAFTVLYTFAGSSDGATPNGLMQASDGNLYGTTQYNGGFKGQGTVFQLTPGGTFTVLHTLSYFGTEGYTPLAPLVQASDGNLYGTTSGGNSGGAGTVFRITTSGTFTTLTGFSGTDGATPAAALVQASDGNLYGTTEAGGANGDGTVFKMTLAGTLTDLYSFAGGDGSSPIGLIQGANGRLYGTCYGGGPYNQGTVFGLSLGGTFTSLYSFGYPDDSNPVTSLVQGRDGTLYGTCYGASDRLGLVFKIATSGKLTILHGFDYSDGANPAGGLIPASDGNLYGTTYSGGANATGTVYRITPQGVFTSLYSFSAQTSSGANSDGAHPAAGLVQASDGNLYGTCSGGGANSGGTVFRITASGTVTTLYSFHGPTGAVPLAGLIEGKDGALYGTAAWGGTNQTGTGTVFKITTSGAVTRLYSFTASNGGPNVDGAHPKAALIQASDGNLYGTTSSAGANASGTVFRITPSGTFTTVYSFSAQPFGENYANADGAGPVAALIQGSDGNLYGTCSAGGFNNQGTVFKITTTGLLTTLHSFDETDGGAPQAALIQAGDGNLYGTTSQGGANGVGTVFKIRRAAQAFDAYGDANADILLQNSTSADLKLWELNGLNIARQSVLDQVPALDQQIVGTGDFNGAGYSDLLCRDTHTGDVTIWGLIGSHVIARTVIYKGLPLVWQVAGIGDFNGDGKADILWRNTRSGDVVVWIMDGASITSQTRLATLAPDWQVVGVGDFNGDGTDDVLWFNATSREVLMWQMLLWKTAGYTKIVWDTVAGNVPADWQVAGIGDLNNDGRTDVVWQNPEIGEVVAWEMNGSTIVKQGYLSHGVTTGWQVAGLGDFNGDGRDDVLWRNTTSGDVYLWEMNGLKIASEGYLAHGLPLLWKIVAP